MFSFVSWPFSLKLLWAPLVDSLYVPALGQRRTWLLPVQALVGVLLVVVAPRVDALLGGSAGTMPDVTSLTAVFFVLYLLMARTQLTRHTAAAAAALRDDVVLLAPCAQATQDVAVDGWALTLLSRAHVGWASTVNAIGQTLGSFAAYTGRARAYTSGAIDGLF